MIVFLLLHSGVNLYTRISDIPVWMTNKNAQIANNKSSFIDDAYIASQPVKRWFIL